MNTMLQSGSNPRIVDKERSKVFALICAYVVLALAVGVTRGALQDVNGASGSAAPGATQVATR